MHFCLIFCRNHFQTIYNHQFEVTDAIIAKLTQAESKPAQEPDTKDYLYGVSYPLQEEE